VVALKLLVWNFPVEGMAERRTDSKKALSYQWSALRKLIADS
jgi:hypothetical protein